MSESNNHELTDIGNGRRLIDRHGHNLLHCLPLNQWYKWNNKVWEPVVSGELMRHAKDTAMAIAGEAQRGASPAQATAIFRHATTSQSAPRLKAMIELAASEEAIAVASRDLDSDPFLFCSGNGTINLKTGELSSHSRQHLITQHSEVEYIADARAPLFDGLVHNLTGGDQELGSYLQRAVGYTATGSRQEHALFVLHGPGGEGKTTFLEAIAKAFGAYAQHVPTETLMAKRSGGISNDVARMRNKRLGYAGEIDQGKPLDEALMKQLSGGDTITARGLYQEH